MTRSHDFELPKCSLSLYKRSFVSNSLFNFIVNLTHWYRYICIASCNLLNILSMQVRLLYEKTAFYLTTCLYTDILSQNYVLHAYYCFTVVWIQLMVCLIQQIWVKLKLILEFVNPWAHGYSSVIVLAKCGPVQGQILRDLDCYGWFMKWVWVIHFAIQNILCLFVFYSCTCKRYKYILK